MGRFWGQVRDAFDLGAKAGLEGLKNLNFALINSFEDAKDAVDALGRAIKNEIINQLARAGIKFALNLIAPGLGSALGFAGFQQGGLADRGLALVGEAGPEIVDFRQPGRVYTNDELGNAISGSGGGNVFNFAPNIYSADNEAVRSSLSEVFPLFVEETRRVLINDLSTPTSSRALVRG